MQIHTDHTMKATAFFEFFKGLMGMKAPPTPIINWNNLYPNRQHLEDLITPITREEIQIAISQWPNNKSPGPEGFLGEFYKTFINILTEDLFQVFRHVMLTKTELHPLNSSFIVLILKKENSQKPEDF